MFRIHFRIYDKAIPIPTQTDPIRKTESKSTSSREYKDSAVRILLILSTSQLLLFVLDDLYFSITDTNRNKSSKCGDYSR